MVIDRVKCTGCGVCTEHCYTNAKTICGKKMTADEIFREVMKDAVFYRESGGGVTLSGGEAAINSGFCAELFKKLHREGIHTAIETSGYCSPEDLLKFDHYTDLFLFDLKAITGALHASWTGVDNTRIKSNLVILLNKGRRVIIRIPLIPGVNDGTEFERMMKYLVSLEKIKEVHILPFHQLGSSKYRQAGTDYKMEQVEECSAEQAEQYAEICRSYGFVVNIGGWDCR
jgi:pyruvate formate lyase activating enzyme